MYSENLLFFQTFILLMPNNVENMASIRPQIQAIALANAKIR